MKKIKEVIKGEKSKAGLTKELETNMRTLDNRIQELSVYNAELYKQLINKKPFRSKTRDDIRVEPNSNNEPINNAEEKEEPNMEGVEK